ncbi:MAG TPA: Holliday junction branch migration protein RuvA [Solirubrobacteraceae bacterium]|nr:Holliday junction branch migration protein RuvA [Solirubrobacteraceae bacterium]
MIAMLRGEVAVRGGEHITLMCGAVGYRLAVSAQTLAAVGPPGEEATLHTHLIVRDDALVLVGFATEPERELFLALLAVPAVGPKLALAVLGSGPVSAVVGAIAAGDTRFFQGVPGVGKRTAERIIVELREKVGAVLGEGIVMRRAIEPDAPRELAREGLLELGYAPPEAERLLADVDGDSAEELLAAALRATRRGSSEAA